MHSLLFAALETFSLVLKKKRKKKNPKRRNPVFQMTSCVSLRAVLLMASQFVWSLTSFTCSIRFVFLSVRHEGFQLSSHHPRAVPAFKYPDILQIVVLNLLSFLVEARLERSVSHFFWRGGGRQRRERAQMFLYSKVAFYDIIPSVLCNVEESVSRGVSRTGRAAEAPDPGRPACFGRPPFESWSTPVLTEPSVITWNPHGGLAEPRRPPHHLIDGSIRWRQARQLSPDLHPFVRSLFDLSLWYVSIWCPQPPFEAQERVKPSTMLMLAA